ncbi:Sel1-like repeat [Arabidopsis thaliana x Arabidopsis arenosa]|uniref:Sel1-like repeat n=1 Tax=Arabidopsis thaliana x Arabidopsis arenosa TaxID=1240361 RepID=A0A8T2BKN4_9BRAS|nr:Sel1-like repeat [Arabidopsis thaliana x Arabidopsis arenosa]
MKQRTWPCRSEGSRFTSLSFLKPQEKEKRTRFSSINRATAKSSTSSRSSSSSSSSPLSNEIAGDFSMLPFDILMKIAAPFSHPNLQAASSVCKSWRDALKPLRESMLLLRWGKKFKHGRGGVRANLDKALDSFLKGAARGSTLAMVDAGLVYWETGEKEKAMSLYRRAAELGDAVGQCNLGICYLQVQPSNPKEAMKWLKQSSENGYVRAQYQLALCLHQGRVVKTNLLEASKWYLKAAEGGYVRAMYNISLCYSVGEGLPQNRKLARKWMKRAADHGHSKAQFEHGLALFSEGAMLKSVLYLELAERGGESAATHIKEVIHQQLSATSRGHLINQANNWRPLPATR